MSVGATEISNKLLSSLKDELEFYGGCYCPSKSTTAISQTSRRKVKEVKIKLVVRLEKCNREMEQNIISDKFHNSQKFQMFNTNLIILKHK